MVLCRYECDHSLNSALASRIVTKAIIAHMTKGETKTKAIQDELELISHIREIR